MKYENNDKSINELRDKYDQFYSVTDDKFNKSEFEKMLKKKIS